MSDNNKLGRSIDHGTVAHRDAIHIAIAPVVAGQEGLKPGDRIGLLIKGDTETVGKTELVLGIVDPFLRSGVLWEGQRFYMLLLPNTITSLRHEWTHPAFGGKSTKDESQAWIEGFAAELDQTYSRLMDAAERWIDNEGDGWSDGYTRDDSETYKNVDGAKWPLFWQHYEIVTGRKPKDATSFFTCSC